ncbi:hypothetical protein J8273_3840 [Carpediemonas membranifera]|uniref:Uncharacterized protein n=1 Tax=Carpediemonas membranifera TaxID=201153 RepID=A0A8J6E2P5_9EUKA|nr:hypothetical protein J8273_3840 [Carpediemonas membranifera]|eukprot:KAG9394586.1 hypothetical protein J8273_3840 [Carpediemonas membranifera]
MTPKSSAVIAEIACTTRKTLSYSAEFLYIVAKLLVAALRLCGVPIWIGEQYKQNTSNIEICDIQMQTDDAVEEIPPSISPLTDQPVADDDGKLDPVEMLAEAHAQVTRLTLVVAIELSLAITRRVSGDIPTLLRVAYERQYGGAVPTTAKPIDCSAGRLDELAFTLSWITLPNPAAAELLAQAVAWLERATSEEGGSSQLCAPVGLHSLPQATVWAILTQAGATTEFMNKMPDHSGVGDHQLTSSLWFMNKKCYFTHNPNGSVYLQK